MAGSDWLFSVGVDLTSAQNDIVDFVTKTGRILDAAGEMSVKVVDTKVALDQVNTFVNQVNQRIGRAKGLNISVDLKSATSNLNAFAKSFDKNSTKVEDFIVQLKELERAIDSYNKKAAESPSFAARLTTAAPQPQRQSSSGGSSSPASSPSNYSGSRVSGSSSMFLAAASASKKVNDELERGVGSAKKSGDAFDELGRIVGNSVFKLIEFEVVMAGFNTVVQGLKESLTQAGNVQMEQTLQGLYGLKGGQDAINKSLANSIVIAQQWGSEITDVQQVIGLWSKNTGDLAAATYLANQSEMLHRASGIETTEVYRMSIALLSQLGDKMSALPHIYDMVAEAALKVAVPMKDLNGKGSQEAMKDIFEGLADSTATLKEMGFDTAGVIAVVSNQVQAMGENGKQAGANLASMFAALEGRGKGAKVFQDILGPFKTAQDSVGRTSELMDKLIAKGPALLQAYKNGDLGVKPAQYETLQTFIASLGTIKKLREEIMNSSQGKLELISEKEMNTFNGQVDRMKATIQTFSLSLGTALLPGATAFVRTLDQNIIPSLVHFIPAIIGVSGALIKLGGSLLLVQAGSRLGSMFTSFATAQNAAAASALALAKAEATAAINVGHVYAVTKDGVVTLKTYDTAQLSSVAAIKAATDAMEAQKAVIADLDKQQELAAWQTKGYAAEVARVGTTQAVVNDIIGKQAPTAFENFSKGIRNAAGELVAFARPLLQIYAAMEAIESITKGLDPGNQQGTAVNDALEQGRNKPTAWYDPRINSDNVDNALQKGAAFFTGNGQKTSAAEGWKDILAVAKVGGPEGSDGATVKSELDTYIRAITKGNDKAALDAENNIKRAMADLYENHHGNNVSGFPDLVTKTKEMQDALNRSIAAGAGPPPENNKQDPTRTKGVETDSQLFGNKVGADKRDANASISYYKDSASAAQKLIDTNKLLGETYGYNAETIKALGQAYDRQKAAIVGQTMATIHEIDVLKQDIAIGQEKMAKAAKGPGGKKSTLYQQDAKAVDMAQDALLKARGAVNDLTTSYIKLDAERRKAFAPLKLDADFNALGPPKELKHAGDVENTSLVTTPFGSLPAPNNLTGLQKYDLVIKNAEDGTSKGGDNLSTKRAAALNAEDVIGARVRQMYDFLNSEIKAGIPVSDEWVQALLRGVDALSHVKATAADTAKEIAEAQRKSDDWTKSLRDMSASVTISNAESINNLEGTSDPDLEKQKAYIEGMDEVRDKLQELDDQQKAAGQNITQAQLSGLNYLRQELVLRAQLLKATLDQNQATKNLQADPVFQAVSGTIAKRVQANNDAAIEHELPAKGGTNSFQSILGDILKQTTDAQIPDGVTGILTSLLGKSQKSPSDEMAALDKAHETAMQAIMNGNAASVEKFGQSTQDLKTYFTGFSEDVKVLDGATPATQGSFIYDLDQLINGTPSGSGGSQKVDSNSGKDGNYALAPGLDSASTAAATQAAIQQTAKAATDQNNIEDKALNTPGGLSITGISGAVGGSAGAILAQAAQKAAPGTGFNFNSLFTPGATFGQNAKGGANVNGALAGLQMTLAADTGQGGLSAALSAALGTYGAINSIGGPAAANSPIGLGVTAASGLLGFFSNHATPADEPDVYNTQSYGQLVSNLNGISGTFNGTTIMPSSQYSQNLGNLSEAQQLQQYLANPANYSNVSGAGLQQINQLKALGGTSGNLAIQSEKNGVFTLASGQQISVAAYTALINNVAAIKGNTATIAAAPLMSFNAYGSNTGSVQNVYNQPGEDATNFAASQQNLFLGMGGSIPYYGTPGVGTTTNAATSVPGAAPVAFNANAQSQTIQLVVDGQTLAAVVNSVNSDRLQRNLLTAAA